MLTSEKANAIGKEIADRCCRKRKKDGSPTAPERYAIIYQAAAMGAQRAIEENNSAA